MFHCVSPICTLRPIAFSSKSRSLSHFGCLTPHFQKNESISEGFISSPHSWGGGVFIPSPQQAQRRPLMGYSPPHLVAPHPQPSDPMADHDAAAPSGAPAAGPPDAIPAGGRQVPGRLYFFDIFLSMNYVNLFKFCCTCILFLCPAPGMWTDPSCLYPGAPLSFPNKPASGGPPRPDPGAWPPPSPLPFSTFHATDIHPSLAPLGHTQHPPYGAERCNQTFLFLISIFWRQSALYNDDGQAQDGPPR